MVVLLLGANGLLGHNVLCQLLQQGHTVHALLRRPDALQADDFPRLHALRVFQGSLLNDADLMAAMQGCDAVVNCAGVTSMSLLHYRDYLPVNRHLCQRLVALMEQTHITRLVHTSTANTIGHGTPTHTATEADPAQPPFSRSFYGRSKRQGELLLLQAAQRHPDWHIVILNPGFMVGPYDTKPSSGALLLAAYRKPLMLAPKGGKGFIHVADVAAAAVNALTRGAHGARYLLTAHNLSLRQFYALQARTCGYRQCLLPVPNWLLAAVGRVGDLLRRCGIATQVSTLNVRQLMVREHYSSAAARRDLGLPLTPLSQAIADFFAWRASARRR